MNKSYLIIDKKTKEQIRILTLPEGEKPRHQLEKNEEAVPYDPVTHGSPFSSVLPSGD